MASQPGIRPPTPLHLVPAAPRTDAESDAVPSDDAALLAAIHAGRPEVADQLCRRLAGEVQRTVWRLLGRLDADRDDLVQVSLMEIVKTIDRYRGDCPIERWASIVTSRVVFKHLRRRRLEHRLFVQVLSDGDYPLPAFGEPLPEHRDLLRRIAGHLDQMKTSRAWVFMLHEVLGHDLREIAQMTESTVAAAQSRLSRSRRELQARMADDPDLVGLLRRGPTPPTSASIGDRARQAEQAGQAGQAGQEGEEP